MKVKGTFLDTIFFFVHVAEQRSRSGGAVHAVTCFLYCDVISE